MRQRRDPVTSTGLRVAQAEKLSSTMERNLRRLREAETRNTQAHLPSSQAMALERRGLVVALPAQRSSYVYGGMPCDLTPKGRRIAREL